MLPTKTRPRYLPTLTNVVTTADLVGPEHAKTPTHDGLIPAANELLVQQIVQSIMPLVIARMHESLQKIMEDKLRHLDINMQIEVENLVRSAVNDIDTPNMGS